MNIDDKIFDGDDRAHVYGFINFEAFLAGYSQKRNGFFRTNVIKNWNGMIAEGPSVYAHINGARWSIQCFCGQYSYVTPRHPIHWCLRCGNKAVGEKAVPVVFPDETTRIEIERLLLLRPVQPSASDDPMMAASEAIPLIPGLRRDWYPGQTPEFLDMKNRENGIL
jgi:hypothetical protein